LGFVNLSLSKSLLRAYFIFASRFTFIAFSGEGKNSEKLLYSETLSEQDDREIGINVGGII